MILRSNLLSVLTAGVCLWAPALTGLGGSASAQVPAPAPRPAPVQAAPVAPAPQPAPIQAELVAPAPRPEPSPAPAAPASAASQAPQPSRTAVRFLVVAAEEGNLSAVVPGRVARLPVALGDTVKAGQLVAAFDCAEVQARRNAAKAEHTAARLQYEAKAKLQGLDSAAEVEVELAAANVNRTQSQVQIFDAQVGQCSFVSPFNGRVARVHVKIGQGVNAGTPIIDLVSAGAPKARLNVPSAWLAWLKIGERLNATVDETGGKYVLKVARISARVDAVSQTVEIEAAFEGQLKQVLPGMSGQAQPLTPH